MVSDKAAGLGSRSPNHFIVWEFRVRAGSEADFESAYGPSGDWARLFAQSAGYLGTELLSDPDAPGRYLTMDRWESKEAFAQFKATHSREYAALDDRCEKWTTFESAVGSWVPVL